MTNPLRWLAINDDVDAEFIYWKDEFLFSSLTATGFGIGTAVLIALWPPGAGNPELRAFARDFWTLIAECAFWLGFLLAMLWGAAKRIGSGLSGILPWQPRHRLTRQAALLRWSGQWACWFALMSLFLWITLQVAKSAVAGLAALLPVLVPLTQVSLLLAAALATVAVAGRERRPGYTRPLENHRD